MLLNLNIGVLGHVDSGKTSISKALSTISSTAAFDKNPQSQERGITIDLGFSSFTVDLPEHISNKSYEKLLFTLVDCPGHASLIKTIIGGAQIIDLILLVVDITKGIQAQTAECFILGEITGSKMIVVLNKIDLLPSNKRETTINKVTNKMQTFLKNTIFKGSSIIPLAANPGGGESSNPPDGINHLIETLKKVAFIPPRSSDGPFLFAVDHCFGIRGQGTVLTGTVLRGSIQINDVVEIPSIKINKKVKSIQMFKQPVQKALQGDRLGICVTQLDPKLLERGLICTPGFARLIYACIINVNKIRHFKEEICSRTKFHVTIGHRTVIAKILVFEGTTIKSNENSKDQFDWNSSYEYQNTLKTPNSNEREQYLLLELEHPIVAIPGYQVIGSRLDGGNMDNHQCRLAFHGHLISLFEDKEYTKNSLPKLKILKEKIKEGFVDRIVNERELIVKDMFKKETNIQLFIGFRINISTGESGIIQGTFGQSGKIKVYFQDGLNKTTIECLTVKGKGKNSNEQPHSKECIKVRLCFKKALYDENKKVFQI